MKHLKEIRTALEDSNLKAVAEKTGVHQNTIYRIMSGETNPSYETVMKLVDYINNKNTALEQ